MCFVMFCSVLCIINFLHVAPFNVVVVVADVCQSCIAFLMPSSLSFAFLFSTRFVVRVYIFHAFLYVALHCTR